MTLLEAKKQLCNKLNISYANLGAGTDDLFSWDGINDWINLACLEAWDYHDWIFKESAKTTTTVASQEYYDYPPEFISDSIFLLRVADSNALLETYKKIRYLDFMKYREDSPTGVEKYWSDHRRWYFVNPKAFSDAASRSIEVWGMLRFTELAASTTPMPFSPDTEGNENSGNNAIVNLAYAMALDSEKKNQPQKAQAIRAEAYNTFKILADREKEAQADYEVVGTTFFRHMPLFDAGGNKKPKRVYGSDDSWAY